jgi:Ala-tRNA(Pro) deacylase
MYEETPLTDQERQIDARQRMIDLFEAAGASYHIYQHRPIRNYSDAELARQESGFFGTESKSMVLKSGDTYLVYVTLAGNRIDLKAIRAHLGGPKPKIASDAELWDHFAAEAGAAYPFGFDQRFPIYVDPAIYGEEWLLLSLVLSTETVQVRGADMGRVFEIVANPVEAVTTFNQAPAATPAP